MKRNLILVLTALLLMSAVNVWAQDDAPTCDAAATADVLIELVEALRTADSPIEALGAIRDAASIAAAACSGLNFNSDDEGMMPVIGPVEIPEGLYRATLTTDGYFIMELDPLSGKCGEGSRFSNSIYLIMAGTASDGAQVVINSEGCEALFSISNVNEPWTLSFEKLR